METRGKLYIISKFDSDDVFEREVTDDAYHSDFVHEFIESKNIDSDLIDFEAPYVMPSLGYLAIKTDDDSSYVVCYIPNHVTDVQLEFMRENMKKITNGYKHVVAYYDIDEDMNNSMHAHGVNKILEVCEEKNIIKKEKRKIYVRY